MVPGAVGGGSGLEGISRYAVSEGDMEMAMGTMTLVVGVAQMWVMAAIVVGMGLIAGMLWLGFRKMDI